MNRLLSGLVALTVATFCAQAGAQITPPAASVSVLDPATSRLVTVTNPAVASATNNVSGVGASSGTASLVQSTVAGTAWTSQTNLRLVDSYTFANLAASNTYAEIRWTITATFATPAIQPADVFWVDISMGSAGGQGFAAAATDCSQPNGHVCTVVGNNLTMTGATPLYLSNDTRYLFLTTAVVRGGDNGRTDLAISYALALPDGTTVTTASGYAMPIVALVPEPGAAGLLLAGLPFLAIAVRRRSHRTQRPAPFTCST